MGCFPNEINFFINLLLKHIWKDVICSFSFVVAFGKLRWGKNESSWIRYCHIFFEEEQKRNKLCYQDPKTPNHQHWLAQEGKELVQQSSVWPSISLWQGCLSQGNFTLPMGCLLQGRWEAYTLILSETKGGLKIPLLHLFKITPLEP